MGEHSASRRYGRLDDTRLAALVRKGDTRAFEVLYDRHHAPLLAFCRHMLGSLQEGEDALQQTFIRAHRALSDRPPPDAVRPWLFTIARNRCRTSPIFRARAGWRGLGPRLWCRSGGVERCLCVGSLWQLWSDWCGASVRSGG
jgi:hypothetical protein